MANAIAQTLLASAHTRLQAETKEELCNSRTARSLSQCPEKSQDKST